MDTRNVLRMAGVVAVLICLILLIVPSSTSFANGATWSCGNVFSGHDVSGTAGNGCDAAVNNRLTISLVVGAIGLAEFFGASQVKKREDD